MLAEALDVAGNRFLDIGHGFVAGRTLADAARQARALSDEHAVLILLDQHAVLSQATPPAQ